MNVFVSKLWVYLQSKLLKKYLIHFVVSFAWVGEIPEVPLVIIPDTNLTVSSIRCSTGPVEKENTLFSEISRLIKCGRGSVIPVGLFNFSLLSCDAVHIGSLGRMWVKSSWRPIRRRAFLFPLVYLSPLPGVGSDFHFCIVWACLVSFFLLEVGSWFRGCLWGVVLSFRSRLRVNYFLVGSFLNLCEVIQKVLHNRAELRDLARVAIGCFSGNIPGDLGSKLFVFLDRSKPAAIFILRL